MRTVKNEDITIPNTSVINSAIINYSSSSKDAALILHLLVDVGYDVPVETVNELLVAAAYKTPYTLTEPKPFTLQKSFNDFAFSYEINVYTKHPEKMSFIYSELHKNILDAFDKANVSLDTPSQIVLKQ